MMEWLLMFKKYHLTILFLLLLISCGYRFSGESTSFPGNIQSLCLQIPENRSLQEGFELQFSDDLFYELSKWKKLRVSYDDENAQGFLTGQIKSISTDTASRDYKGNTKEKRIKVVISLSLINKENDSLWSGHDIEVTESLKNSIKGCIKS